MMGGAVLVSVHLIDDSSSTWSSGATLALKAETYKINKLVLKNNKLTGKRISTWHITSKQNYVMVQIHSHPSRCPHKISPVQKL